MQDRLTILGGGGWFPAQRRHTACALWRRGNAAILIDAGTGVGRLVERPELLDGVERLDILLTHFHLDHVCGLAYLPAHEPFHPVPLEDLEIDIRELPATELELGSVRLWLRTQRRHSAPSLGLRFDDQFTWITDTAYDPESAGFAAGCSLLAHESWFIEARPRNADIHSSAAQAATVARDAGIEDLLLIHLPPFEAEVNAFAAEARQLVPRVVLAAEGIDVLPGPGYATG